MASLRRGCAAALAAVLVLPEDAAPLGSRLTGRPLPTAGTTWSRSLWSTAVCMGPIAKHIEPVSGPPHRRQDFRLTQASIGDSCTAGVSYSRPCPTSASAGPRHAQADGGPLCDPCTHFRPPASILPVTASVAVIHPMDSKGTVAWSRTLVVLEQGPVALDELRRVAVLVVHPLRGVLERAGERPPDYRVERARQTSRLLHLRGHAAAFTLCEARGSNAAASQLMFCSESNCLRRPSWSALG